MTNLDAKSRFFYSKKFYRALSTNVDFLLAASDKKISKLNRKHKKSIMMSRRSNYEIR